MPLYAEQLVTLAEARAHLNDPSELAEVNIQMKLNQATAIILDYIGSTAHWRTIAATWTENTVPAYVHAAILLQLAHLYANHGDQPTDPNADPEDLAPGVRALLRRSRDPVLA